MFFQALTQLAKERNLVTTGQGEQTIRFVINIGDGGRYIQVVELPKNGKSLQTIMAPYGWYTGDVVSLSRRTVNIASKFVIDSLDYQLGYGDKAIVKHNMFRNLIQEAVDETNDPSLIALLAFLLDDDAKAQCIKDLNQFKKADNKQFAKQFAAFRYCPDNADEPEMIHERPAVRAFWESLYENNLDLMAKPQTCTVCGQLRRPVRLHQKVQGLGQDTPLVSADKPAYLSYGFEGGCDTAPFCYRCMVGYVTALNYLINDAEGKYGHSFPLGKKTIVAYWSRYPIPKNILANLGFIDPDTDTETNKENNGEPQKSQNPAKIIDGLLEGNEPRLDLDHVHTLALTAQSQRITIQGYLDITVREFYQRVRQFFRDSEVPRKLSGNYEDYSYTGINSIVNSLLPPGRNKDLPTRSVELLHAILEGKPFPAWVLYALLDRYQSDRIFSRPRLAILRAVLVRLHRQRGNEEIVTVSLNREFPSVAYHLGRLLAVAHRQQYFAIGKVNRNVVDVYYSSLSTTPLRVLPALCSLFQKHKSKQFVRVLDEEMSQITEMINVGDLPAVFKLENRAHFALGFQHETTWLNNHFFSKSESEPDSEETAA